MPNSEKLDMVSPELTSCATVRDLLATHEIATILRPASLIRAVPPHQLVAALPRTAE